MVEGTPFGRYRLIEILGRGGMGEVWRAFDTVTERVVALKVLPAQFINDEVFQERFRREARSAAGLDEPHVVPIHDFGEIDGRLYVTMRLIEGRDLQSILTGGPLEPDRAVHIIDQVASALNAAHRIDLVHRDVKPSNILVADEDFTYLIDFGIARATGETSLTNTGNVLGTWAYLAPERLTTGQTDHRADIYALTCVMHECLTGNQPFPGDSMEQQIGGHLTQPPPRPSTVRHELPNELDAVIAKGMAKNPDERYATTKELAKAARAAISTGTTGPRSVRPTPQPHHSSWSAPPAQYAPGTGPNQYPPTAGPTQYAPATGPNQFGPPQYSPPAGPTQYGPPAAPTHYSPAAGPTHYSPAPGPTFFQPPPGLPPGGRKKSKRNLILLASGAGVIALVIAVVLVMVLNNNGKHGPIANTGPFTGLYRADFGASTTHGSPDQDGTPSSGQFAVRSACGSNGCVATAKATGGPALQSTLVFDELGSQWHAVAVSSVNAAPSGVSGFTGCKFPAGDFWTVITLQAQSDGTFTGEYFAQSAESNCITERTVTFTRVGDADLNDLPDPADQPARVASPAEGLHGHYHATLTPLNDRKPLSWDTSLQTECLRTGGRCLSYKYKGYDLMPFENGNWTYAFDGQKACAGYGSPQTKINWVFPLVQPAHDPITLLTGHGHRTVVDTGCAGSWDEDVKYERTGD